MKSKIQKLHYSIERFSSFCPPHHPNNLQNFSKDDHSLWITKGIINEFVLFRLKHPQSLVHNATIISHPHNSNKQRLRSCVTRVRILGYKKNLKKNKNKNKKRSKQEYVKNTLAKNIGNKHKINRKENNQQLQTNKYQTTKIQQQKQKQNQIQIQNQTTKIQKQKQKQIHNQSQIQNQSGFKKKQTKPKPKPNPNKSKEIDKKQKQQKKKIKQFEKDRWVILYEGDLDQKKIFKKCSTRSPLTHQPSKFTYLKIVPLSTLEKTTNYSIFSISFEGVANKESKRRRKKVKNKFKTHLAVHSILPFLRRNGYFEIFNELNKRHSFPKFEHPIISQLFQKVVIDGDWDSIESKFLMNANLLGLFNDHVSKKPILGTWDYLFNPDSKLNNCALQNRGSPSKTAKHQILLDNVKNVLYLINASNQGNPINKKREFISIWKLQLKKKKNQNQKENVIGNCNRNRNPKFTNNSNNDDDDDDGFKYLWEKIEPIGQSPPKLINNYTSVFDPIQQQIWILAGFLPGHYPLFYVFDIKTCKWNFRFPQKASRLITILFQTNRQRNQQQQLRQQQLRQQRRYPQQQQQRIRTRRYQKDNQPKIQLEPIVNHKMIFDPESRMIYIFGGVNKKLDYFGLYSFNVNDNEWKLIRDYDEQRKTDSIILRSRLYHGMVLLKKKYFLNQNSNSNLGINGKSIPTEFRNGNNFLIILGGLEIDNNLPKNKIICYDILNDKVFPLLNSKEIPQNLNNFSQSQLIQSTCEIVIQSNLNYRNQLSLFSLKQKTWKFPKFLKLQNNNNRNNTDININKNLKNINNHPQNRAMTNIIVHPKTGEIWMGFGYEHNSTKPIQARFFNDLWKCNLKKYTGNDVVNNAKFLIRKQQAIEMLNDPNISQSQTFEFIRTKVQKVAPEPIFSTDNRDNNNDNKNSLPSKMVLEIIFGNNNNLTEEQIKQKRINLFSKLINFFPKEMLPSQNDINQILNH
ncbi:muskelin [Anaeramoeba flamelloides]|uniref:Muskelin n=1 Tax=Anaeramoeba flamelloides TaxID=1746091 RepID=A0ABQ8XSG3_9EUKA|nr:muskelin [Anaeramoeba flamelloides]